MLDGRHLANMIEQFVAVWAVTTVTVVTCYISQYSDYISMLYWYIKTLSIIAKSYWKIFIQLR